MFIFTPNADFDSGFLNGFDNGFLFFFILRGKTFF